MILAIDTATDWTGLALHDGAVLLAEMGWRSRHTQTIELTPAIEQMWRRVGVAAADVRAIAVSVGPGSYTGLRVGMAVAKGLALANRVPLVGVSTLDILASAVGPREGTLVVTAEAGRKRVWAGRYQWNGRSGWQVVGEPLLLTWESLLGMEPERQEGPLVEEAVTLAGEVSQEALKLIRRGQRGVVVLPPAAGTRRAGYLAEIGWQRFKRGRVDAADALSPLYWREAGA